MGDREEPIIHQPSVGETLTQYLKRYTHDETLKIFEDQEKRYEFCTVLLRTSWSTETLPDGTTDRAYQKLYQILQDTEDYNVLLTHIKLWEPSRRDVLKKLSECANELKTLSNWCSAGRIIGCTIESLSTIWGLEFANSNNQNYFLNTATLFGGLGFFLTMAEIKIAKDTYCSLLELIERDKNLFAPIQTWYQQSEEVGKAMRNIFPFDLTRAIVEEFSIIVEGKKNFDPVNLLCSLFAELVSKHKKYVKDEEFIEDLIHFVSSTSFKEFCEWIFLREMHPAVLEITKMVLQYVYSPAKYIICQRVAALAPANQNLYSIPVMGRLLANGFSLVNEFSRLHSFQIPGSYKMQDLENRLRLELEALSRIVKTFGKIDQDS